MTHPRINVKSKIKRKILERDGQKEAFLSSYATIDAAFLRRHGEKLEDFLRQPYSRDSDRILHSKAYSRYIDKTQVFYLVDNDHITHRVLHVQLVSKIAQTIGRALGLNEDLLKAISIGHDIGHVPYGHFGEGILSNLCEDKYGIGKFSHNVQAIRFLDKIEDLDLTLQVLDGILCHDGERHTEKLSPIRDMTWDAFDLKLKRAESGKRDAPMTLEGCVVRFADSIAYLGRDLQDAREIGLITNDELKDIPGKELLDLHGKDCEEINWLILDTLIKDLINNSFDKDEIAYSKEYSEFVYELKKFNKKLIYENQKLHEDDEKIKHMFETLFEHFLSDFNCNKKSSPVYTEMYDLNWISSDYKENVMPEELVRDYIAGMTDRYFNKKFSDITELMPKRRECF